MGLVSKGKAGGNPGLPVGPHMVLLDVNVRTDTTVWCLSRMGCLGKAVLPFLTSCC